MNKGYINFLKAEQKSENTIKNYAKYVGKFLDYVGKPDTEIVYADIIDYEGSISNLASNSVRLQISAIKNYFRYLTNMEIIDKDPSLKVKKPDAHPKQKVAMSEDDVEALLAHARTDRDYAIVKFMISTGLRVSEMINITLDEYHDAMENNHEIEILGKGRKHRRVKINADVENAIDTYLNTRHDNCPYLFASFRRTQIDPESLSKTLKTMARNAGLPYANDISNHWLRAGFATIANKRGYKVAAISQAMGHSSIAVTSIYIKNSQDDINDIMDGMTF